MWGRACLPFREKFQHLFLSRREFEALARLDGAKYHVREILGKLGAENREQAVEVWTRERRPLARFVRWSRGLFAVSTARTVTLAGLGIAAAGVTAVAVVVALGGDETSPADDPPSARGRTSTAHPDTLACGPDTGGLAAGASDRRGVL